jgi:hypothetical protein
MEHWINHLTAEDGELTTKYFSEFFKRETTILFMDTEDKIQAKQTELVNKIISQEHQWIEDVLKSLVNYYKEGYADYKDGWEMEGADEATIEEYLPKEMDREKLLTLITPADICIFPEESCDDGSFGFTLDCTWDDEHGLGINFRNWKITDVGGMDVALIY